jgi:23S rRNA (cytosine1962-C5)-methyltransferase
LEFGLDAASCFLQWRIVTLYIRLAALRRPRTGGLLIAASCSAHVSAEEFYGAVEEALRENGLPFRELWRYGHAPDHPAAFREAEYLKAVCVELKETAI